MVSAKELIRLRFDNLHYKTIIGEANFVILSVLSPEKEFSTS